MTRVGAALGLCLVSMRCRTGPVLKKSREEGREIARGH